MLNVNWAQDDVAQLKFKVRLSKYDTIGLEPQTPKLVRVAQRKKSNNKFWLEDFLLGCLCNSKLQKTKKFTEPFGRAGGTQAEKSTKFGLNGLYVSAAISKMAQWIFLFFSILNHIKIPTTNFEVRIHWSFFPKKCNKKFRPFGGPVVHRQKNPPNMGRMSCVC